MYRIFFKMQITSYLLPLVVLVHSAGCSRLSYKPVGTIKLEVPAQLLLDRLLLLSLRDDGSKATLRAVSKLPDHRMDELTNEDFKTTAVSEIIRKGYLKDSKNEAKNDKKVFMIPIRAIEDQRTGAVESGRRQTDRTANSDTTTSSSARTQLNKTHGEVREEFLVVMVEKEDEDEIDLDEISEDLELIAKPRAVVKTEENVVRGSSEAQDESLLVANILKNLLRISNPESETNSAVESNKNFKQTHPEGSQIITTHRPIGVQLPLPPLSDIEQLSSNPQLLKNYFSTLLSTSSPTVIRTEKKSNILPTTSTFPAEKFFSTFPFTEASVGVPLPSLRPEHESEQRKTVIPLPETVPSFTSVSEVTPPVTQPTKAITDLKSVTTLPSHSEKFVSRVTNTKFTVTPKVGVPLSSARPFETLNFNNTIFPQLELSSSTQGLATPATSPFIVKNSKEPTLIKEIVLNSPHDFFKNASSPNSTSKAPFTIVDSSSEVFQSVEDIPIADPLGDAEVEAVSSEDVTFSHSTKRTSLMSQALDDKLITGQNLPTQSSEVSSFENDGSLKLFSSPESGSNVGLLNSDILDDLTPDTIKDDSKESKGDVIEDLFSAENWNMNKHELKIQLQPKDNDLDNEIVKPLLSVDERDETFSSRQGNLLPNIINNSSKLTELVDILRKTHLENLVAPNVKHNIGVPLPGLEIGSSTSRNTQSNSFQLNDLSAASAVPDETTLRKLLILSNSQPINISEFSRLSSLRSTSVNSDNRQLGFNFPNQEICPTGQLPAIDGKCKQILQLLPNSENTQGTHGMDQLGLIDKRTRLASGTKPVAQESLSPSSIGIPLPILRTQQFDETKFSTNASAALPSVGIPLPSFSDQPRLTSAPTGNIQFPSGGNLAIKVEGRGSGASDGTRFSTTAPVPLPSIGIPLPSFSDQSRFTSTPAGSVQSPSAGNAAIKVEGRGSPAIDETKFGPTTPVPLSSIGIPLPAFRDQPRLTSTPTGNIRFPAVGNVAIRPEGRGSADLPNSSRPTSDILVNRTRFTPTTSDGSQNTFLKESNQVNSHGDVNRETSNPRVANFRDSSLRVSSPSPVRLAGRQQAGLSIHRLTSQGASTLPNEQGFHQSEIRNIDALLNKNNGIALPSAALRHDFSSVKSGAVNLEESLRRQNLSPRANDQLLNLNRKDFLPPKQLDTSKVQNTESLNLNSRESSRQHISHLLNPSSLLNFNHQVLPIQNHFTTFRSTTANLPSLNDNSFRNLNFPNSPSRISSLNTHLNFENLKSETHFQHSAGGKNPSVVTDRGENLFNNNPFHVPINYAGTKLGSASGIHSSNKNVGPPGPIVRYGPPPVKDQKTLFTSGVSRTDDSDELTSSYSTIGSQQPSSSSFGQKAKSFLSYGPPPLRRHDQLQSHGPKLSHAQEHFTQGTGNLRRSLFGGNSESFHKNAFTARTVNRSPNVNGRLQTQSLEFGTISDHLRRSQNSFSNPFSRRSSSAEEKSFSFSSSSRSPNVVPFKPSPQLSPRGTVGFWRKGGGVNPPQTSRFTRMIKPKLSLWEWANQL